MKYLSVFITVLVLFGCTQKKELQMILTNDFVFNNNDKEISLYTLKNENGLICQQTNFGARVVSLWTPDNNGELGDVVVGYGTGEDFVVKKENYFGATIESLIDSEKTQFSTEFQADLLSGVEVVKASGDLYNESFTAIPYYVWNNRGANKMEVWLPGIYRVKLYH